MKRLIPLSLFLSSICMAYPSTWVRIATGQPGIYEIPYSRLIELGFTHPESVGLVSRQGSHGVFHSENSLLFFHKGCENVSFVEDKFVNHGLDIYSSSATLLLTDDPRYLVEMVTQDKVESAELIDSAAGYVVHENDLFQNSTNTGNIFWGENLDYSGSSSLVFKFNLPATPDNMQGIVTSNFFFPPQHKGSVTFSTDAGDATTLSATTNKFTNLSSTILSSAIGLKSGENIFRISYSAPDNAGDIANLDYWILNYEFKIGETLDTNPSVMALPGIGAGESRRVRMNKRANPLVFDVTDPVAPRRLPVYQYGIRNVFNVTRWGAEIPVIALKEGDSEGLTPLSYAPLDHDPFDSTLKSHAEEGADMVIVTPQWLMQEAEALANLHREHDGLTVVTTSVRELYDAYSCGHPTPEAYHDMVREFCDAPVKLRNLMLFGPLTADARGMGHRNNPDSLLIVPQCRSIHYERGAQPAIPYYGAPSFNISNNLESADVKIGLGLLPVVTRNEAADYVAKVERWLKDDRKCRHMADMLWMGGTGDNHTHDQQAVQLGTLTSNLFNFSLLQTVVAFDAYGARNAKQKILDALDEGRGFMTYIGHAGPTGFGAVSNVFTGTSLFSTSDALRLKNHTLPFLITAGCITTNCDSGERGVGEHLILSTPNGAIGGLLTVRETWSGQNYDFLSRFFTRLSTASEWSDTGSPTVGEVYARTLNDTKVANELAFLLVGDPALQLPVPVLPVKADVPAEASAGEWLTIHGNVSDSEGSPMSDFRGTLCAKLLAPSFSEVSADYITGDENTKKLTVEYDDEVISMGEAVVENGEFSLRIPIPMGTSGFSGQQGRVILSAFDVGSNRGAGASYRVTFSDKSSGNEKLLPDALSITGMEFDGESATVEVSFNTSNGGGVWRNSSSTPFEAWLDGERLSSGLGQAERVDDNGNFRRIITLPHLLAGTHSLDVTLEDAAGNQARKELLFDVGVSPLPLTLTLSETAIYGSGHFQIDPSAGEVKLLISDTDGVIRHTAVINGNEYEWDGCGDAGESLPSGVYKACIIETGSPDGNLRSSGSIPVAVISPNITRMQ